MFVAVLSTRRKNLGIKLKDTMNFAICNLTETYSIILMLVDILFV